jgi:FkbM family methyltransferase
MTWVSYAQNYEDVVLARVLADVRDGFWIDVGAQDPRMDSVTCAFAERGWRGINLEPVPHWHARLAAARPRDVNLCLAAGDRDGVMRLFEVADSGLSTGSPEFAARYRADGRAVRELEVPVRTLAALCAEHVRGPVHFLKVDAEGAEAEVLRGMDFAAVRPWVVLVEATAPNSRVSLHDQWEPDLLAQRYAFAYGDGINRYYLAEEHAGLAPRFGPPTVFDDFLRREQVDAVAAVEARAAEVDALSHRRAEELDALVARIAAKDAELADWQARWQAEAEAAGTLRGELGHAASREGALHEAHAELAAREAVVSAELDRMHREAAVLQSALADGGTRETALRAALDHLGAEDALRRAALLEADVREQALQAGLEHAQHELVASQSREEALARDATALRETIGRQEREAAALQLALDEAGAREAALRVIRDRLQGEVADLRASLAAAGLRETTQRAEADALRAALARAEARAVAAEQAVARFSLQVPDLQAQVRAAAAAHAIAHAELLRHVGIIEALRAEHAVLLHSRSWRLTAPLRGANALLARWRERAARRAGGPSPPGTAGEAVADLPLTEDAARILAHAPVVGAGEE